MSLEHETYFGAIKRSDGSLDLSHAVRELKPDAERLTVLEKKFNEDIAQIQSLMPDYKKLASMLESGNFDDEWTQNETQRVNGDKEVIEEIMNGFRGYHENSFREGTAQPHLINCLILRMKTTTIN